MALDFNHEDRLADETWQNLNKSFSNAFTGDATQAVKSAIDDMESGRVSDDAFVNVWDSVRDSQYYGVVRAEYHGNNDYSFELDIVGDPVRVNFKPNLNNYERDSSPYLGQSRYIDFDYNKLSDTYSIRSQGIQFGAVEPDMLEDLRQSYVKLFDEPLDEYEVNPELDDHMDAKYDSYGLDDYDDYDF